jgi:hypothetical protein
LNQLKAEETLISKRVRNFLFQDKTCTFLAV